MNTTATTWTVTRELNGRVLPHHEGDTGIATKAEALEVMGTYELHLDHRFYLADQATLVGLVSVEYCTEGGATMVIRAHANTARDARDAREN